MAILIEASLAFWQASVSENMQVQTNTQEKGEDWEHEEERADDDLEQGDEEGSDQDVPTTGKK